MQFYKTSFSVLLFFISITVAYSTITINSYPPPFTAQCNGYDGIDEDALNSWKDAYIDSNPATTDCGDGPDLDWYFDDMVIHPFHECDDFMVSFEVMDECGDMEFFDVTITFTDDEAPILNSNISLNQTFYCDEIDELEWEIDEITEYGFTDNCLFDHDINTSNDYCGNTCNFQCPDSFVVNFTAEDDCNNSATYSVTFNLVSNLDPDNDGIDIPDDNCPNHYNPGQEDIDSDGIGNSCDTMNEVGEIAEIQSNLYLSAPYSGLILKSEDGSCYILIVNNNGSLATLSVDCP